MNLILRSVLFNGNIFSVCRQRFSQQSSLLKVNYDVRVAENLARRFMKDIFSKDVVKLESVERLLQTIRYDVGRYSNNITKGLMNEVYSEIKKKEIPMTISHLNFMLETFIVNEIEFDPKDIILEIKANNLSLNNVTLDLLLKAYCLAGDMDSSLALVEKMIKLNIYLNATKYSWLVACAIRSNNSDLANKYFHKLETEGLNLSYSSRAFIARAYASQYDVDNCIKMLDHESSQEDQNYKSSLKHYCFIELLKHNAKYADLIKFIHYLNKDVTFKSLILAISKLNTQDLFEGSMLLVKNTSLSLDDEQWKILLLRFLSVKLPIDIQKTLLSKFKHNKSLLIYALRFIRPLDEALDVAEDLITYDNLSINNQVCESLLVNIANENDNFFNASKKVMTFIHSRIRSDDYYRFLITKIIGCTLRHDPGLSYDNLIARYKVSNQSAQNNFIFCCVIHSLIIHGLESAKLIYENYFENKKVDFKIQFKDLSFFIMNEKGLKGLCDVIVGMNSFLGEAQYLIFVGDILIAAMRILKLDDFEYLFKFVSEETKFTESTNSMKYLKNKKCPEGFHNIIEKYSPSVALE